MIFEDTTEKNPGKIKCILGYNYLFLTFQLRTINIVHRTQQRLTQTIYSWWTILLKKKS